jgi:hypothetical protein
MSSENFIESLTKNVNNFLTILNEETSQKGIVINFK